MTTSRATISDDTMHTLYGETMGTRWRVVLRASPPASLERLHGGIQGRLDAIVAQMSTWEPESDISRFNRADAGSWHLLSDSFFTVLSCALDVARDSHGAFDPTLGPLVAAWGFGAKAAPRGMHDADSIDAAKSRIGWRRIALDAATRRALQPGRIALDLSAIAKGFAVDDVCAWLQSAGIAAALVDVGGELRGFGRKPDGSPWRVLVETGDEHDDEPCMLSLDGRAVATSGTHWHRYETDGREFAHTIDPHSGQPVVDAAAAVTVVADDAMHADAWATALTVMGVDAGFAHAKANGMAVRFVRRNRDGASGVLATPAFEAMHAA